MHPCAADGVAVAVVVARMSVAVCMFVLDQSQSRVQRHCWRWRVLAVVVAGVVDAVVVRQQQTHHVLRVSPRHLLQGLPSPKLALFCTSVCAFRVLKCVEVCVNEQRNSRNFFAPREKLTD